MNEVRTTELENLLLNFEFIGYHNANMDLINLWSTPTLKYLLVLLYNMMYERFTYRNMLSGKQMRRKGNRWPS